MLLINGKHRKTREGNESSCLLAHLFVNIMSNSLRNSMTPHRDGFGGIAVKVSAVELSNE